MSDSRQASTNSCPESTNCGLASDNFGEFRPIPSSLESVSPTLFTLACFVYRPLGKSRARSILIPHQVPKESRTTTFKPRWEGRGQMPEKQVQTGLRRTARLTRVATSLGQAVLPAEGGRVSRVAPRDIRTVRGAVCRPSGGSRRMGDI